MDFRPFYLQSDSTMLPRPRSFFTGIIRTHDNAE